MMLTFVKYNFTIVNIVLITKIYTNESSYRKTNT